MAPDERKIIAVVGPTASGKTSRAVTLAKAFDGEIVSADSRQVYRRMDIGTGKDIEEYGDVPYHLIDICEPGEKYNLYRYLADYNNAVEDIASRHRRPIVCGGSGMYVEAALNGMVMPEVERNEELRARLAGKSLGELTDILASMKTLHNTTDVDNVARALRAIEIQTYYAEHPEQAPSVSDAPNRRQALIIGIEIDRDSRRRRISERLRRRLDEGMVDEIKALLDSGIEAENLIYYGLEYKWLTLYVTGQIDYRRMVEQLETAIHQFAKRQMTWFRGMERRGHPIRWIPFDATDEELIDKTRQWLCE